jgi:hypothetical protein
MILFKAFREFWADIEFVRSSPSYLGGGNTSPGKHARQKAWFRLIVQTLVTFIGLGAGFYMLLSAETSQDVKKYGSGLVGMVMGFWLRIS